jgi:hypothetical protein
MSGWSLGIRVVLSCCLIFSGSGTGLLAHAQSAHATNAGRAAVTNEPAAGEARGADTPCHGSHPTPASGDPQPSADPIGTEGKGTPPVCCLLAACGAACLQHAPAVVSLWTATVVVTRTADEVLILAAHAAPDLAQLIRPPNA